MTWRLYKRNDPNTWPQIDCPVLVYDSFKQYQDSKENVFICYWDNDRKQFYTPLKWCDKDEYYYTYIAFIPSGYKTVWPIKCTKGRNCCEDGYDDEGYCMADNLECKFGQAVPMYNIEEKSIWREFDCNEN